MALFSSINKSKQKAGLLADYVNMDDFLDDLIPEIKHWSEDLHEKEYYTGDFPWMEIKDEETNGESILHFFKEEDEYLYSINGTLATGVWKNLESNKLILERHIGDVSQKELFDLEFMNGEFLILQKPGDQRVFGKSRYLVLGKEAVVKNMDWREAMAHLSYNHTKGISSLFIFAFIFAIALILYFSWR